MMERFVDIKVRTGNSEATVKSLDSEIKELSADTKALANESEKARIELKAFEAQQKKLGNTTNALGVVYDSTGQAVTDLSNDYLKLKLASDKAAIGLKRALKPSTQLTESAKGVNKAVGGVGRSAGQAGIQVQQFIGQIQGGQNAMLALSAQSADLGFVLGAPLLGAVVGIGASLVGILAPSFFKTSEAAKDFTFNVAEAAKELKSLDDLSKSQVAVAITDVNKSMEELSKEAGKYQKSIAKLTKELDTNTRSTHNGRRAMKLTSDQRKEATEQLDQERANLDKINQEMKKESDLLVKLSKNKDGFSKKTEEQSLKVKNLTSSLDGQIIALRDGEQAAFRYSVAQQLELAVIDEIPVSISRQIDALFKLKKAREDAKPKSQKRDRGDVFTQRLSLETEALKTELALRQQVEQGFITQSQADASSRFISSQSRKEAAFNNELVRLGENEIAKAELTSLYREQEILSAEIFAGRMLELERSAADDRIENLERENELRQLTRDNDISNIQTGASASLALLKAFGNDSFKQQKAFSIAESVVNIAAGVAKALNNPFPANLGFAASVAAQGAGLLSTIKSTNPSSGGGTTSISSSSSSSTPATTTNFTPDTVVENTAITELSNDLRNSDQEYFSAGFVRKLFDSLKDAQASGQV